jgi:hypothetical protein
MCVGNSCWQLSHNPSSERLFRNPGNLVEPRAKHVFALERFAELAPIEPARKTSQLNPLAQRCWTRAKKVGGTPTDR